VFEGVDGVGKSTIITEIVPLLQEVTGLSDTLQFHWKPCKRSIRICAVAPPSHDPRGQPVRGQIASVLFLGYHWLGFWVGWLRWVYPALTRSQSVVCDRYAVDLWLDPRRFRLALPEWLLKIATRTVPQPGLVIGLVAAPEVVTNRKAELTHAEITVYQERLEEMARNSENICLVDATGPPAMVVAEVRHRILNWLEEKTQHHG
jgi:thymidylate kinase